MLVQAQLLWLPISGHDAHRLFEEIARALESHKTVFRGLHVRRSPSVRYTGVLHLFQLYRIAVLQRYDLVPFVV